MPSPYNESDCEDWYATDSEEDAASPAPASSSTVTTTGGNPGKRRADNAPARPAPQKKRQRPAEENSPSPVANDWEVKPIGGTCPPLNSKSTIVDDPTNHRVFFVGGIRPGEESEKLAKPTSDLWCYDTKAMTWIDLTNRLTFDNPDDRFERKRTPLPKLSHPGCCLVQLKKYSYLFMIGGFDGDSHKHSTGVIIIDPGQTTWGYADVEGGDIGPRVHPAVTSVGSDVYVFGGYTHLEDREKKKKKERQDCGPLDSYCVLSRKPNSDTWRWRIRNRSYIPNSRPRLDMYDVPQRHAFGAAIPVYGGKKILLLPGRHTEDTPISFRSDKIFFYHIGNDNFQPATPNFVGDFPQGVGWHCSFEYLRPAGGSAVNGGSDTIPYSTSISPSIIIGGWIKFQGALVPELWHLALSPEDCIQRLNLAQHIWDLDHNFQSLILAEGRLRLLGSEKNDGPEQVIDAYTDLPV